MQLDRKRTILCPFMLQNVLLERKSSGSKYRLGIYYQTVEEQQQTVTEYSMRIKQADNATITTKH